MNFEENFQAEYDKLNPKQKQAVDQIDGPVMVLAGPGTGKTQLLSMRVGNILRQTDVDPQNILCLTFTDNASQNMTARMSQLFGKAAYKVAVFTFHAFAQSVINQYPEFFFGGAAFEAADDITRQKVIGDILRDLPLKNPLAGLYNDQPIYLSSVAAALSDIKRAGMWPDQLLQIVDENSEFIKLAEPLLAGFFSQTAPRKQAEMAAYISQFEELNLPTVEAKYSPALAEVIKSDLKSAAEASLASDKPTTKFITEFRNKYLEKNRRGDWVMKDRARGQKTKALAKVYQKYLDAMSGRGLYDFDDMILRLVTALELMPELKFNLQERFQYILVDEFQDTNDAQMKILTLLTDYDPRPNLMTVGDHKQAIFRFQGAEVANVDKLANRLGDNLELIELEDNYRSSSQVLRAAASVIGQSRPTVLAQRFLGLLTARKNPADTTVSQISAPDWTSELAYVADDIARQIKNGLKPEKIAVIAKYHRDLADLVPFLATRDIAAEYDKNQDILSSPPVKQVELLSRLVVNLNRQKLEVVNELVPQLLAHPAWGFRPTELWKLALAARWQNWLDIMLEHSEKTKLAAEKILQLAQQAQTETLEEALDAVFEVYRQHFFSDQELQQNPERYLNYLADLSALRRLARDYKGREDLVLADLVELIDTYRDLGQTITVSQRQQTAGRLQLLTAHKAKGLEFDTVYIINGTNEVWANSRNTRKLISFPANLPLAIDDSEDERARLFYVAMTRAERQLFITTHQFDEQGRQLLPCSYLTEANLAQKTVPASSPAERVAALETEWSGPLTSVRPELKDLLAPDLETYQISPTHLNTFTDLEYGGPQAFLLRTLLRFPEAKSPAAGFGTAVHEALQFIHTSLQTQAQMPDLEQILNYFDKALKRQRLSKADYAKYQRKGRADLAVFVKHFAFEPEQISERRFNNENVILDGMRLNGTVDMMVVDKKAKTIKVYDYKTGKAYHKWDKNSKLHNYRQQLMFYKLLIENSREFAGYEVVSGVLQFVEPLEDEIAHIQLDYNPAEMAEFKKLLAAVWKRIMALDLPDVSAYEANLKGTMQFEKDMIQ